ncbi:1-deoxy-D-xylulose 5-phosphate reductoisomerase [Kordiimonas sediminis]|uniref:1-deoxy-D-xylulose 5-phosphate reductoisomerase n=1 Tax=Kordiimonas sediminis TaxID=1735581 RepID=A0A919AXN7_9PROT|nr:1-deoxy-D-xylulose-5-phosphate reductoisomerase [Kordiimonas sediminis]GHF28494.1 1-deoxy-D-xylulose 5-phosphate reductoisomerase [Kordiimonas sediminis]
MATNCKTISILGATGSVGLSTIDLIRRNPDIFQVRVLTAQNKVEELAALAIEFQIDLAVIGNEDHYGRLKELLSGTSVKAAAGQQALIDAASVEADLVMAAIVGAAGLRPTLEAVRQGNTVALANKECLVCAGDLMMEEVRKHGTTLLPVDSEHNAIFQVFEADQIDHISKIILTASGGPFLNTPKKDLLSVTPAQAVAHPNWDMGAKISVDSATMMNKGLEVIEAYHLFPVEVSQIEVLVHPQSVIHSMVEYGDGSVLAQLGSPDMRTPIAYALAWPQRMESPSPKLNLAQIGQLDFREPDLEAFPCLALALEALKAGGAAPVILNAANEVAVESFLNDKIGFMGIASIVEKTLSRLDMKVPHSIENLLQIDLEARKIASALIVEENA